MSGVLNTHVRPAHPPGASSTRTWKAVCGFVILTVVLCLTLDAAFDRSFARNISDGIAYLDIRDALASGRPAALLNSYWSPGYPVALFLGLALLHPSPAFEIAAIYSVQWFLALLALASLVYFVSGIDTAGLPGTWRLNRGMLLACGGALFLVCLQEDVPIALMTPDVLLAALLWLAGGAFLRIARHQRWLEYVLLGIAVSLAYFTKAAALSLVLASLAILPFTGENRRRAIRGAAVSAAVAIVLIAPYIARLSAAKGKFTFGESGGLNYAWIVDGADSIERWHMQSTSPHGHARMQLLHPARLLLDVPEVYEFASPVEGHFPTFDDPSYWDAGLHPTFYLKGEIKHIALNLYHTVYWLTVRGEFTVGILLLFWLQRRFRMPGAYRQVLPVLVWLCAALGMYVVLDVEGRYVFALLSSVLLLAAATVRLPDTPTIRRAAAVCVLVLACGTAVRGLGAASQDAYSGIRQVFVGPYRIAGFGPFSNPYWPAAKELARLGLRPNDSVACMQLGCDNAYWLRPAGLRVIAQVSGPHNYWDCTPEQRSKAMAVLAAAGVKALVTRNLGKGAESEGWIPLSDPTDANPENLYARLVQPPGTTLSKSR